MDGVSFLRALDPESEMPVATPWAFRVTSIAKGEILGVARPDRASDHPLGDAERGFAETVLDIALGLVTISVLDDAAAAMTARTDLTVRHVAPVLATTGALQIRATVVERDGAKVVAEAFLEDRYGMLHASATSTCAIAPRDVTSE